MKIKSICLAFFSFFLIQMSLRAQSLDEAFKQAKKENKLVMISVESATCNECNEVAAKGLSSNLVKSAISNNCILLKVKKMPNEFYASNTLYILYEEFFGVLFFMPIKIYWI